MIAHLTWDRNANGDWEIDSLFCYFLLSETWKLLFSPSHSYPRMARVFDCWVPKSVLSLQENKHLPCYLAMAAWSGLLYINTYLNSRLSLLPCLPLPSRPISNLPTSLETPLESAQKFRPRVRRSSLLATLGSRSRDQVQCKEGRGTLTSRENLWLINKMSLWGQGAGTLWETEVTGLDTQSIYLMASRAG